MHYTLDKLTITEKNVAEKAIQVFKDHFVSVLCARALVVPHSVSSRAPTQLTKEIKGGPKQVKF